jgi:hypothetical protein
MCKLSRWKCLPWHWKLICRCTSRSSRSSKCCSPFCISLKPVMNILSVKWFDQTLLALNIKQTSHEHILFSIFHTTVIFRGANLVLKTGITSHTGQCAWVLIRWGKQFKYKMSNGSNHWGFCVFHQLLLENLVSRIPYKNHPNSLHKFITPYSTWQYMQLLQHHNIKTNKYKPKACPFFWQNDNKILG